MGNVTRLFSKPKRQYQPSSYARKEPPKVEPSIAQRIEEQDAMVMQNINKMRNASADFGLRSVPVQNVMPDFDNVEVMTKMDPDFYKKYRIEDTYEEPEQPNQPRILSSRRLIKIKQPQVAADTPKLKGDELFGLLSVYDQSIQKNISHQVVCKTLAEHFFIKEEDVELLVKQYTNPIWTTDADGEIRVGYDREQPRPVAKFMK